MPSDRTLTVIQNGTTLVNNQYVSSNSFSLPMTAGGGIAITHNKRSTLAADYVYENWAQTELKGNGWQAVNNNRISAGYEITRVVNKLGRLPVEKSIQFGAYYNSGYLYVNNKQINDYGVTLGAAGNIKNLLYNLSLNVGQRGTEAAGLIRENYFQLTLGLSYRDFLFSKGRKFD